MMSRGLYHATSVLSQAVHNPMCAKCAVVLRVGQPFLCGVHRRALEVASLRYRSDYVDERHRKKEAAGQVGRTRDTNHDGTSKKLSKYDLPDSLKKSNGRERTHTVEQGRRKGRGGQDRGNSTEVVEPIRFRFPSDPNFDTASVYGALGESIHSWASVSGKVNLKGHNYGLVNKFDCPPIVQVAFCLFYTTLSSSSSPTTVTHHQPLIAHTISLSQA
tara:strand:+ start:238 stop:888 length:651 start_codon:yes stop_codon:yes gene_type:complete